MSQTVTVAKDDEAIGRFLRQIDALLAAMESSIRDADPANVWRYTTYKIFASQYNDLAAVIAVADVLPLDTRMVRFDLEKIPESGDTVAMKQQEVFELVRTNLHLLRSELVGHIGDGLVEAPGERDLPSGRRRLFISHSSDDKDLADLLFDQLFRLGLQIETDRVFYSSRGSTGPEGGENWLERLKDELGRTPLTIVLVTESYHESALSHLEAGAAWVSGSLLTLRAPGVDRGIFGYFQCLDLDNSQHLDKLATQLADELDLPTPVMADWNHTKETFLRSLPSAIKQPGHSGSQLQRADRAPDQLTTSRHQTRMAAIAALHTKDDQYGTASTAAREHPSVENLLIASRRAEQLVGDYQSGKLLTVSHGDIEVQYGVHSSRPRVQVRMPSSDPNRQYIDLWWSAPTAFDTHENALRDALSLHGHRPDRYPDIAEALLGGFLLALGQQVADALGG